MRLKKGMPVYSLYALKLLALSPLIDSFYLSKNEKDDEPRASPVIEVVIEQWLMQLY